MNKTIYKKRISDNELREMFSFLKILGRSGISLEESLELMKSNLGKSKGINFNKLATYINEGKNMHKALESIGVYDKFVLSVIEVYELAGNLPQCFEHLEKYYVSKIEIKSEVFKIFAYPVTVLISVLFLIGGIITYIIPQLAESFFSEGDVLPSDIKFVLGINSFINNNMYSIFVFISVISILILTLFSNERFKENFQKFIACKSLFSSINNKVYIKNFAWKIHILLNSGVDIYSAIGIVKSMERNMFYNTELTKVERAIFSGVNLTVAFKTTNLFDDLVVSYVSRGVETDNMANAFENIWILYDRYINEYIKKLKAVLQPVTILILGIVVALLAVFVMSITNVSNFVSEVS
ncbi:MAG: type II secretion system F family protein [Filifactoraceae bacterium]